MFHFLFERTPVKYSRDDYPDKRKNADFILGPYIAGGILASDDVYDRTKVFKFPDSALD